jgi:hypothetical protein
MKKVSIGASFLLFSVSVFACDPFGWTLVKKGQLSAFETVCTYSKNGYTINRVVSNNFCPMDPCSKY